MEDFKVKVKKWRESLGMSALDDEMMRSLCHPEIRPVIEDMMKRIRPVEEVQMIRRQLAMHEMKKKFSSEETNPKDEERKAALLRKYKVLKMQLQEKKAKVLAQKERIESLKREIEQKYRKVSSLQYENSELNKQTLTASIVSEQLVKNSKRLADRIALYHKNVAQEQQSPPSETTSIADIFTAKQEKAIMDLLASHIPAPPEPVATITSHTALIESKVQNITLKKQLKECDYKLEMAVEGLVQCTMQASPEAIKEEMVRDWGRLQVTRKTSDIVYNSLKEIISARSISLRCDIDYLRLVLIDAEKKLNTLDERYKSVQKDLIQLAKDLSFSWQSIEEAAEKARSKRSQLKAEFKEAQVRLSELANKLRVAGAVELKVLHETMTSLITRDATAQEVPGFGTVYNDLFYILRLVAEKRTAKHVTLSSPEMLTALDDPRLEHLISGNSETRESERYGKFSNEHIDAMVSKNDRLIQSLSDLIAMWWQPPFETAVPEELVVSGKNILQHTAHWDRVTTFLGKKQMKG